MSRRAETRQVQDDRPLAAQPSTESARRDLNDTSPSGDLNTTNTTSGGVTAEELQRAEADYRTAYRTAMGDAERARAARTAAIRQALADGWTHQQIADAMGITRGRVSQVKARA